MFIDPLVRDYSETNDLVGLCDAGVIRASYHLQRLMREYSYPAVPVYRAQNFDDMVRETHPDVVIVWTPGVTKVRELIAARTIGDIKAVNLEYQLNTSHGADYCRRWHSDKSCSGGLLIQVNCWSSEQFVAALRHDPANADFNPSLRQLLHVGYKIAAQMGDRYLWALQDNEEIVAKNVTENLFDRYLKPLFVG
jgi:hypothetical protein